MNRPGWNPTRRNRNIGTPKQGRGRDNQMAIPCPWFQGLFWNQVGPHKVVRRAIGSKEVVFVIEQTREGYVHACTVEDLLTILRCVPWDEFDAIDGIFLRQPTVKQERLSPAWGRLGWWVEVGEIHGPAITLEAIRPGVPFHWSRRLTPDARRELDRLEADGHRISFDGRRHVICPTLESIRTTQLYRTLLHEIGHWVDFESLGNERFSAKPQREKEAFAHRYAERMAGGLRAEGVIPFPRKDSKFWDSH